MVLTGALFGKTPACQTNLLQDGHRVLRGGPARTSSGGFSPRTPSPPIVGQKALITAASNMISRSILVTANLNASEPPMGNPDLSRLIEAPGGGSLLYVDPLFPDRPLVLHAARPGNYHPSIPILFVHHGVGRNGRDYRDYWLDLVDETGVLALAVEFPEASFPEHLWYHFGNLHDKDGRPNPRQEWTFGIVERLFQRLLEQGVTT